MKKARIEVIDIAKAVTIFLVIVGHSTGNFDTPLFRRVLYSFHMPLFFILAGMSVKPMKVSGLKAWRAFLRKNILALITPYIIWGLIYAPFDFGNFPLLIYASHETITEAGSLTSLWYLPSFFVARVITQIIVSVLYSFDVKNIALSCGVIAVPVFAAGFVIAHPENGLPFGFDVAIVAAGFILLGMAMQKSLLILAQQTELVLGTVFAGSLLIFAGGTVIRGDALELSAMARGMYGNIFWFMLNSLSGSALILLLSMIVARIAREGTHPFSVSAITYIGSHTMGIYLVHKNMLQDLFMPFVKNVMPENTPLLLLAVTASVMALIASMIVCVIIGRYVPQMLGRFPRNENQTIS